MDALGYSTAPKGEKKIEPYVLIWKAVHDILSEKDRLQSSVYI